MKKLILKVEGERARRVGVTTFLKANKDGLSAREKRQIRALKAGEERCFGGGAAVAFCVTAPGKGRLGAFKPLKPATRTRLVAKKRAAQADSHARLIARLTEKAKAERDPNGFYTEMLAEAKQRGSPVCDVGEGGPDCLPL